jgi:phosphate starvation-inducible PhoH-like protein
MSEAETHYFDSWDSLNSVFAGNLAKNLKSAEQQLGIQLVARDTWVKVIGDDPERLKQAVAFLTQLTHIHNTVSRVVDQRDFDQVLAAYSEKRESELQTLFSERIKVSPKKRDIIPRTGNQLKYLRQIKEKDIVFGIGPAGTGKTYLAMAMAVSELLAGKYSRIILTRPAIEAGENLGYLPGNLEEKIMPYLRPLYDALYDMLEFEEADSLIEKNIIEVAPLAFMRGRTLNGAFIILDEAQNTSPDQMLMFLTRLGFNSCCVITGDPSQNDLGVNQRSGLEHSVKTLSELDEIGICQFSSRDVVRHALVEKIINAYQQYG